MSEPSSRALARRAAVGYLRSAATMLRDAAARRLDRTHSQPLAPSSTNVEDTGGQVQAACVAEPVKGLLAQGDAGAPAISVIMPVFNALRHDGNYLEQALASVAGQILPPTELIVVDDGSTDGSGDLVREFGKRHTGLPLTVLRQENAGQSSARNLGARHACGEWLAFLDQDDEWKPQRLATVAAHLTAGVDFVYTDADVIAENGTAVKEHIHRDRRLCGDHPRASLDQVLVRDAYVMPGVVTVNKRFFEDLGGFDEALSGYEDDDLFTRAYVAGRLRYVPESTLRWRQYDKSYSWSSRMAQSRLVYWRKLMETFAQRNRQREQGITLRFFRDFLIYSYLLRQAGNARADEELSIARQLLPHLSSVDRVAFRSMSWACTRTTRPARFAFYWFIRGSDRFG